MDKLPYLPLQVALSGPDAAWKTIRNLYFALVNGATDHIYIQSPFFILDSGLAEAFSSAARSGVEVKIMLAPAGPDMPIAYRAGHTYAENMAETGVEIYYYQGEYLHAKTIMVDSVICSNGSSNMDIRSFSINYDSNVVIFDPKLTQELEAAFIKDLDHCKKFDVDAYKDGHVFGRARDSFFRLASPLL